MIRPPQKQKAFIKKIKLPDWAKPYLDHYSYKGLSGGRGSGKSHFFAMLCVLKMVKDPDFKIVCVREIAASNADSVKSLIVDKINDSGVAHLFKITREAILRVGGKGKVIFKGLRDHNSANVKSLNNFNAAWVEEAQQISKKSLEDFEPTIMRNEGTEIWFSWNPQNKTDAVDTFFEQAKDNPRYLHQHINFDRNIHIPENFKLRAEEVRVNDYESYQHIYLGKHLDRTDDQIFGDKWECGVFEPTHIVKGNETAKAGFDGPYLGLDFGYSTDPMAIVKVWITPCNSLYVEKEFGGVKIELDDVTPQASKVIPEVKTNTVRADSQAPQSISHLKRKGMSRIVPCKKGAGSIKEGIAFIRNYRRIYVNPDCKEVMQELQNYKYKKNKGGGILSEPIDKNNHYMDALRYALEPLFGKTSGGSRFRVLTGVK